MNEMLRGSLAAVLFQARGGFASSHPRDSVDRGHSMALQVGHSDMELLAYYRNFSAYRV